MRRCTTEQQSYPLLLDESFTNYFDGVQDSELERTANLRLVPILPSPINGAQYRTPKSNLSGFVLTAYALTGASLRESAKRCSQQGLHFLLQAVGGAVAGSVREAHDLDRKRKLYPSFDPTPRHWGETRTHPSLATHRDPSRAIPGCAWVILSGLDLDRQILRRLMAHRVPHPHGPRLLPLGGKPYCDRMDIGGARRQLRGGGLCAHRDRSISLATAD